MAQLVVRHLEEEVKIRLRRRAVRHGHSMEEEARDILRHAVRDETGTAAGGLGSRIAARFAGADDAWDIQEIRGEAVRPASFDS